MLRVLIVDDDQAFARSVSRALSTRYDVTRVHSVPAALVALRDGRELDAVWSDRQLPEPTGGVTVLCAAARHHPEAVLVMVTGDPDAEGIGALPPGARVFAKTQTREALDWLVARLSSRR